MSFLRDISQTIVEKTNEIIEFPISIMDEKGLIIGSSDKTRLGKFNTAAVSALRKKEITYFESDDIKQFENTYPGVGVPIVINQKVVGLLGIIGVPKEVEKYGLLLKSHVELMCHEYLKKEKNELESKTINNFIHYLLTSDGNQNLNQILKYSRVLGF